MVLRHLGRHIASSDDGRGGDVSRLINGLKVGRRYQDADRLMVLATAACSVAGQGRRKAGSRAAARARAWRDIDRWTRMFSRDGQAGRIERCLFTAIICIIRIRSCRSSMSAPSNPTSSALPITCSRSATSRNGRELRLGAIFRAGLQPGREAAGAQARRAGALPPRCGRPHGVHGSGIEGVESAANSVVEYDEDAFVGALLSVNIQKSFDAVSAALQAV